MDNNKLTQQLLHGITAVSSQVTIINNTVTQLSQLQVSDVSQNISIAGNYNLDATTDNINIGYNTLNNINSGESNIVLGHLVLI